jgi:hypothetical protein
MSINQTLTDKSIYDTKPKREATVVFFSNQERLRRVWSLDAFIKTTEQVELDVYKQKGSYYLQNRPQEEI